MSDHQTPQIPDALVEAAKTSAARKKPARLASVRVSPGGYFAATCALSFASITLFRLEQNQASLIALLAAWLIMPALAFLDRLDFDGATLSRRGLVAIMFRLLRGRSLKLKVEDVERVETSALRTLRRGGRVHYRYRTEITGKDLEFIFASGGKSYRKMIHALLPLIPEVKLDARTAELRDFLCDKPSLNANINQLHLAPSSVLDQATMDFAHRDRKSIRHQRSLAQPAAQTTDDLERGRLLRLAANELRVSGRLRESAEAFRRALLVMPKDGWLIYEFARLLRSQASARSDARLLARSRAALRLATSRSKDDSTLLTRIGESFFEHGEMSYATRALRQVLEQNPRAFRAHVSLAEIALRNGKLAHVVHNFTDAAVIAPDPALARYAEREAEYYFKLNSDDDYLATELRRMNWLQNLQSARRIAARMTFLSILLIIVGPFIEDTIGEIGWALATSAVIAWTGVRLASRLFIQRRSE
ncbi:MAG: hypothetical protein WBP93_01950 [Pyrinomonadaceae bacterium]